MDACQWIVRQCDIYFSADVESDGPVPGSFSMLSFALVAVATFDGERFVRLDPRVDARYWELQPISERFENEALSVNGLDRDRLRREGTSPADAMLDADPVGAALAISLSGRCVAIGRSASAEFAPPRRLRPAPGHLTWTQRGGICARSSLRGRSRW